MHTRALLAIPALLVLLLVPTAISAQTDFDATTNATTSGSETITEPEINSQFETIVSSGTQDDILATPTPSEIGVGVFSEYSNIINDDGTYTLSGHYPYLETDEGDFIEYRLIEDDDMVQIELDAGKFVFDKQNGAVTVFDDEGAIIIDSDSYIVKSATVGTDVWTNLEVNDSEVVTVVDEEDDLLSVSFIRENNEGIFKTEYMLIHGSLKTTAYFTNLSLENQKFSFTETMQLVKDITINDELIDLDLYVGQTFPREVLVANEDLILEIKDVVYGAGIGFEQLWSVSVHEDRMVSLDYGMQSEDIVNIGDTVELDPTLSYTQNGGSSSWSYLSGVTYNFSPISGAIVTSYDVALVSTRTQYFMNGQHPLYMFVQLENPSTGQGAQCIDNTHDSQYSSYRYYTQFNCSGGASSGLESALASGSIKSGSDSYFKNGQTQYTNTGNNQYYMTTQHGYWTWNINYTLPTSPSTPSAPTASANTPSNGQITVNWTAPNDGGSAITDYKIYVSGSGISNYSFNTGGTSTSWVDTNPTLGISYQYQVVAYNSVGSSNPSGGSNFVVASAVPSTPYAPVATDNGDGTQTVTWSLGNANGATISSNFLYYSINGGGQLPFGNINSPALTLTWTAVPNTTYSYQVKSYNANGYSPLSSWGNSSLVTNIPAVPSPPVVVWNASTNTNYITWTAPNDNGSALQGYQLLMNGVNQGLRNTSLSWDHSDSTLTALYGTPVTYVIQTWNANGDSGYSSASNSVTPSILASTPSAPTATTDHSNGTNAITWTAPNNNGATIDHYQIFRNGAWQGNNQGATNTSFTDSSPTLGTSYTYTVNAHNTNGYSPQSSNSNAVVPSTISSTPSAPVATTDHSTGTNTITWTAPSSNGSAITNYRIYENGSLLNTLNGNTLTTTTSPALGVAMTYQISATNTHGYTPLSSASNSVTASTAPDTPVAPVATFTSNTSNTITFTAPSNNSSNIDDYRLYENGTLVGSIGVPTGLSHVVTGITISTTNNYQVSAHNANGWSGISPVSNSVLNANAPASPTLTGSSGVPPVLNWTAPQSDMTITNYKIYRDGTLHDTVGNVLTYSDSTSVVAGTLYGYTVSAVGTTIGEGSQSNSITITAGLPPDAPTGLSTSINNPNTTPLDITVNWSAPAYTGTTTISNYEVYRDGTLVATVGNVLTHTDTVPTGGGSFIYSLKSVTAHGTSVLSATTSQTTATVPPTPTVSPTLTIVSPDATPLNITASWVAQSTGGSALTGYEVFRSADNVTFTSVGTTTTLSLTDTVPSAGLYYYKFSSTNLIGNSLQSVSSNTATPTVPDASSVTAFIANPNPSPFDVTVSFVAPSSDGGSAVTGYNLYLSPDDTTYTQVATNVTSTQIVTVSGVGTHYFKSEAINLIGTGALGSAISIVTPTVPDVPSLTLAIPDPNSFPFNTTATFVAPTNNGGSLVTGYNLYYSSDDITYTSIATATSGTISHTVGSAGTHYFKAESISNAGTGVLSSAFTIATPTVPDASSVTLAINNPNPSPFTITSSLVAPSSDGGSTVNSYNLHYSSDDTTYTQIATAINGTFDYTVSGVGTHYFKSQATNLIGTGVLGSAVSIATPTVPNAPSITLTIPSPDTTPLVIVSSFVTPANNGGSNVTGYNLYHSTDNVTFTQIATNVTADQTTTVGSAGTYYFKAESISNAGTGVLSSAFTIATPTIPSADSSVTLTFADPNATPLDVTVSFTAPTSNGGSNITGYNLSSSPDDSVYTQIATNVTVDQTITVANAGTWYFKSQAINPVGTSAFGSSVSITTATVPVAITDLTTSVITNSAATLTWTEPSNGGSNIVLYKIIRDGVEIATSTVTSYSDSSAITQTSYVYAVISNNNVGDSATSNQLTVLISGVPDAPSLTVSQNSINSLDLSWSIPQDYASAITGYKIERNDGTGYVLELANTGSVSTTYTVNGLIPISEYYFKVSAINGYGIGPGGIGSNWTNPTAPTGFVVIPNSSTSTLDLSWDSNVSAIGYKIEREIGIGNGWLTLTANTGNTNTVYQDSGLTTNIFYNYRISTVSSVGNSIPSSTYAQTTFHLPDPVISLTADDGIPGSIALDWTAPAQPYGAIIGYTIYQVTAPGTTATATAVLSTTLDQLSSIQVTNVGVLYLTAPTVTISAPGGVAPYTQATATATITSFGSVSAITITNVGDGYNTPPTVTMNAPAGNTVVGSSTTLTPLVADTLSSATSYSIAVADPATDYSFAVAPINVHGSTILGGQIVTASPQMTFEGLKINIENAVNPNVNPIIFEQIKVGNATNLLLTYGSALDVTCETTTPFTSTKSTYPNLSETPIGNGKVTHTMAFQNSDNTIVDVMCFDVNNTDIKAQSRIMQNEIPLKAQMDSFNANVFGTGSQFAAIDLMTLVVVIVGMIGFNKKNPAIGLALMAGLLGILSVFGIIQMEAGAIGGFILIVMFALIMGWRRRG